MERELLTGVLSRLCLDLERALSCSRASSSSSWRRFSRAHPSFFSRLSCKFSVSSSSLRVIIRSNAMDDPLSSGLVSRLEDGVASLLLLGR